MGGCRCTYRNCTVRTDGMTHMFHYPVFDRIRCHQWLVNACRLDFLNLTVSQLKNRVVCQHHFKNENFMNFKMDKLTFDAVPTLDGPFCDKSKMNELKNDAADNNLIFLEDIENNIVLLGLEKKANFSVKYGDFLTNNDMTYVNSPDKNDNTQITRKALQYDPSDDLMIFNYSMKVKKENAFMTPKKHKKMQVTQKKIHDSNTMKPPSPNNQLANPDKVVVLYSSNNDHNQITKGKTLPTVNANDNSKHEKGREKKKIQILCEKKISQPMKITGTFEMVSPKTEIRLSKKTKQDPDSLPSECKDTSTSNSMPIISDDSSFNNYLKLSYSTPVVENLSEKDITSSTGLNIYDSMNAMQNDRQPNSIIVELTPMDNNHDQVTNNEKVRDESHQSRVTQKGKGADMKIVDDSNLPKLKTDSKFTRPNSLTVKTKPKIERNIEIEKKREFNMKLKDIISSCLDKMNDENVMDTVKARQNNVKKYGDINSVLKKANVKTGPNINKSLTVGKQKLISHLTVEKTVPETQEYNVAFLEARMTRMEDLLLNKIEQNAQTIKDLKESMQQHKKERTAATQTVQDELAYKKHLYTEISQFLPSSLNSLIYEELFINKHIKNGLKRRRE